MSDVEEKRVFGDRPGDQTVYVGTGDGLAAVAVSTDRVGGFELVDSRPVRDVAVLPAAGQDPSRARLLVATDADVLLGETLASTGFGPALAVAVHGDPRAAAPDGRLAALGEEGWQVLGRIPDVRAMEAGLVAAAGGVYRPDGSHVGLTDGRDVAAAGPFAATGSGLYRLGNGWVQIREGSFEVVIAGDERAHAATADRVYARAGDGWMPLDLPADTPVVDLAYGNAVYAVTLDGRFLASADGLGDWRSTHLGLNEPTALAVG